MAQGQYDLLDLLKKKVQNYRNDGVKGWRKYLKSKWKVSKAINELN